MKQSILDYIRSLSATDKKSLSQKALKTSEEVGELAKAVLPYDEADNTQHRVVTRNKVLEESIDTILCALSIAYDLDFTDEEIEAEMLRKAKYWQELQGRTQQAAYPLPYEIHVTVEYSREHMEAFKEACGEIGVKPILIDAHSRTGATVMLDAQTSSVHVGNNRSVLNETRRISTELGERGFKVLREKIETVPWHPAAPSDLHAAPAMPKDAYFECHLGVKTESDFEREILRSIIGKTTAHLSRNAFKVEGDAQVNMVTLRKYDGTRESFGDEAERLRFALDQSGFGVEKVITEFALYDTKISHDAAWLETI